LFHYHQQLIELFLFFLFIHLSSQIGDYMQKQKEEVKPMLDEKDKNTRTILDLIDCNTTTTSNTVALNTPFV